MDDAEDGEIQVPPDDIRVGSSHTQRSCIRAHAQASLLPRPLNVSILPTIAALSIANLKPDSNKFIQWASIVRLPFRMFDWCTMPISDGAPVH